MKPSAPKNAQPGQNPLGPSPRLNLYEPRQTPSQSESPGLAESSGGPKDTAARISMMKQRGLGAQSNLMKTLAPPGSKSLISLQGNSQLEAAKQAVMEAQAKLDSSRGRYQWHNRVYQHTSQQQIDWNNPQHRFALQDTFENKLRAGAELKEAEENLASAEAKLVMFGGVKPDRPLGYGTPPQAEASQARTPGVSMAQEAPSKSDEAAQSGGSSSDDLGTRIEI
jgi:hypothetical protein